MGTGRQPRISNQKVKKIPLDHIHFSDTYNNRLGATSNSRRDQMPLIDLLLGYENICAKEDAPLVEVTDFGKQLQA